MKSDRGLTSKHSKEFSRSRKASFVISQNPDFSEKAIQTPVEIAEESMKILQVKYYPKIYGRA